jgi:transposase InsO family protein
MRIISGIAPGTLRLAKLPLEPSKEARQRLKWFDYYEAHGQNARLTCRYFGISPQTFYRWKRRYEGRHLASLEDHSHRPRHLRQPTASIATIEAVFKLREENPRWGKNKLCELLHEQGVLISASMVGRIMRRLKDRGVLKEPAPNYVSASKRHRIRPYAQRKPKEYGARQAGDLIELDTLDIRPLPGVVYKHFTAHDVFSRWNVLGISTSSTAATASSFLNALTQRMPFPVKAIQVDGGPEFEAVFEAECQKLGIRLFVLPPRSPKLNGGVERAHRTHVEEFYEVTDCTFELSDLTHELLQWEHRYNTVRPHQALGYLTPLKYLQKQKEVECH